MHLQIGCFYIAIILILAWIVKMILGIDPIAWENLLGTVPWLAVAFEAGAV